MEAVVVACCVLEQLWSWARLAGLGTALEVFRVLSWILHIYVQQLVPAVGDGRQVGIEGRAQLGNQVGERIGEVFVLATSEAVPAHDDTTAEDALFGVERRQRPALSRLQHALHYCAPLAVEVRSNTLPINAAPVCNPLAGTIKPARRRATIFGLRNMPTAPHRAPSRASRACLRSTPQRYPDNPPSLRTTRWHGMAIAIGLAAQAAATARTDFGEPIRLAISR